MADVGCAGVIVADTICGPMAALPKAGELLAVDSMPSKVGGCAANVAIGLAKQGVSVDVAGCVGNDPAADLVISCLGAHDVDCQRVVRVTDYPTSTTAILLVKGEDRRFIHCFGANKAFTVGHIDRNWVSKLKVFYLGGLLVMPGVKIAELTDLLAFCRKQGVVTVVDVVVPRGYQGMKELEGMLPHVDYFTPNDDESEQLTGHRDSRDQLRAFSACGAKTVIVTRGPEGAIAARDGKVWTAAAYREPNVVDPSGSGDAFAAGLVTGIVRGWELDRTLPYAAALGASATRAVGTTDGVFRSEEAEQFVAKNPMRVAVDLL